MKSCMVDQIVKTSVKLAFESNNPSLDNAKKIFSEKVNSPCNYYKYVTVLDNYYNEVFIEYINKFKKSSNINENRFLEKIYRDFFKQMIFFGKIYASEVINEKINSIPGKTAYDYIILLCLIINTCQRQINDNLCILLISGHAHVGKSSLLTFANISKKYYDIAASKNCNSSIGNYDCNNFITCLRYNDIHLLSILDQKSEHHRVLSKYVFTL